MTIEGGSIYNIIRTYNKQIRYGKLASSNTANNTQNLDKLSISPEAKKMMFVSSIASELGITEEKEIHALKDQLSSIDFSKITEDEMTSLKEKISSLFQS